MKSALGSVWDYYPFGMIEPGRHVASTNGYRFGFNGKERDDETSGNGNEYDYGFRIYNPRLGRFLSVDPLMMSYPWYSPYHFAGNKPIVAIDRDGLEEFLIHRLWNADHSKIVSFKVATYTDVKGKKINLNYKDQNGQQIAKGNNVLIMDFDGKSKDPFGTKLVKDIDDPELEDEKSIYDSKKPTTTTYDNPEKQPFMSNNCGLGLDGDVIEAKGQFNVVSAKLITTPAKYVDVGFKQRYRIESSGITTDPSALQNWVKNSVVYTLRKFESGSAWRIDVADKELAKKIYDEIIKQAPELAKTYKQDLPVTGEAKNEGVTIGSVITKKTDDATEEFH